MVNSALLFVSALFFLAVSAILFTVAWLIVTLLLRTVPKMPSGWVRASLFAALLFPPVIAGILSAGGVFLRHSHVPGKVHHSVYCGDIARFLSVPEGKLPLIAGMLIQGAGWLLLVWGIGMVLRLLHATISLDRELNPFLKPPSPKLAGVIENIRNRHGFGDLEFFEADIPMSRSCLLGVRHVRCVLSKALVVETSEEELEAVIAHEASHFRAGDVWRTLVVGTFNCLFFYLRPLRLISRRWREETELACDIATVATTQKPLALASAILRVQGVPVKTAPLPAVLLGFAEEAACAPEKRVERLLAYAQVASLPIDPSRTGLWQWAMTAILFLIGGLLLLSPQALCIAHCSLEAIARTLR